MSWPVAYRRAAPVRRVGGFQPGPAARRALGRLSRESARTPIRQFEQDLAEAVLQESASRLLSKLPGGAVLPLLRTLYELYKNEVDQPYMMKPGGFVMSPYYNRCPTPIDCPTGGPPYKYASWGDHSCNTVGQCRNIGPNPYGLYPPAVWPGRISFIDANNVVLSQWVQQSAPPAGWRPEQSPQFLPVYDTPPGVDYPPWIDPMGAPINKPAPDWPALPRWAKPLIKPEAEPNPATDPQVGPEPARRVDPNTGPTIVIEPGQQTRANPGKLSKPARPPKYTRERKAVIAVGGVVRKLVNGVTETKDLIDALWKALPKDCKGHSGTLQSRMWDLYKCWSRIDIPNAIWNVISNEAQDRFYGKIGQLGRKAVKNAASHGYYRRGVGLQFGDRYRPPPPHVDGGFSL